MISGGNTEQIFKSVFENEYQNLCRYAFSYMGDEHAAEDVVQNTFIKIWERKKDLLKSEQVKYYLVTAVRNNCISELRKTKTSNTTEYSSVVEPEPEPFFSKMLQDELDKERYGRIVDALDKLPPRCREVFLLIKLHGMSYKQAAEILNISVKTVENQMGKAITIFRNMCVAVLVTLLNIFFKLSTT